jgi:sulfur carrier protein ThiS
MQIIMPDRTVRNCHGSPATVEHLLLDLGINPLEVMVIRKGKLLPETAPVEESDEIRIIMISHGG